MKNESERMNRRQFLKYGAGAAATGAGLYEAGKLLKGAAEMDKTEKEHTFTAEGQIVKRWREGDSMGGSAALFNPNTTQLSQAQKESSVGGDGFFMIKIDEGAGVIEVTGQTYDAYQSTDAIRVKYTSMPGGSESKGPEGKIYKIFSIEGN